MTAYFLRRFLLIIPTFLGITMIVFTITRFVPGGPVEKMIEAASAAAQNGGGGSSKSSSGEALSEEQMEQIKAYYGFDKPIYESYAIWLAKVFTFDLGTSTRYNEPVWDMIKSKFPVSIYFGLISLTLTYLVCIPLGILKAVKHGSKFDIVSSFVIFTSYAIPGFIVAILLMITFAAKLEWFPLGGFRSDGFDDLTFFEQIKDQLHHTTLPLIAYVAGQFAVMTFIVKNSLMENLAADYIRTAIAKGLPFKKAVLTHAMRNSLIPIATHFGNGLSYLIAGSMLIETIFNIDGFGLLGFTAIYERDFPVVLGILVIQCLLTLIGNIISDICVAIVDPRVKFS